MFDWIDAGVEDGLEFDCFPPFSKECVLCSWPLLWWILPHIVMKSLNKLIIMAKASIFDKLLDPCVFVISPFVTLCFAHSKLHLSQFVSCLVLSPFEDFTLQFANHLCFLKNSVFAVTHNHSMKKAVDSIYKHPMPH